MNSSQINLDGLSQLKSLILNWKDSDDWWDYSKDQVVEVCFGSTKKTLNFIDINI